MTLDLNPQTVDAYESKTLAEMRQMVFDGLGFVDPLTFSNARTRAELRADLITRLGFLDPLTAAQTRTLLDIRTSIINRLGLALAMLAGTDTFATVLADVYAALGFAAMGTHPPGVDTMLTTFINEAQQTLFRRIELDKGVGTLPVAGTISMDSAPVRMLAIALAKAHYGQQDAQIYLQQVETYLKNLTERTPPNITAQVNAGIIDAQRVVFRRYEMGQAGATALATFSADNDSTTIDAEPVELLALANLKAKVGQSDAKQILDQYEHYMTDLLKRSPPNLANIVNKVLTAANETVFRRYELGNSGVSANSQTATSTVGRFLQDVDKPSVDDHAVFLLAQANLEVRFGIPEAKLTMQQYEQYMADMLKRCPPNARTLVNSTLRNAQQNLYRRYSVFRMERWYTWTTVAGQRFYGTYGDDNANSIAPTGLVATVGAAVVSHTMSVARNSHVSIKMGSGKVLIAGGNSAGGQTKSAEVYDPTTGVFVPTASMRQLRSYASAVLLDDGRVFICGGFNGAPLSDCEFYDETIGKFVPAHSMAAPRRAAAAVKLTDGRVLVVGGLSTAGVVLDSAETYNPSSGVFSAISDTLTAGVYGATATLLADGSVLIAGGESSTGTSKKAHIYDANAGTITATGDMTDTRVGHSATLLTNGKILIAGGKDPDQITSAELYDPDTGTFALTGAMSQSHVSHVASLLKNQKVLIAGGGSIGHTTVGELYDPSDGTFSLTGNEMPVGVSYAGISVLDDGAVLVTGGSTNLADVNTAMLYDPDTDLFAATGSLTQGTVFYQAVAYTANGDSLPGAEAFVAGVPANTAVNLAWTMTPNQPFVLGTKIYGRVTGGSKQLIATIPLPATTYIDEGTIPPDGALPTINATAGPGALDPRNVTWVGASQDNVSFRQIRKGIPPTAFNDNQTGPPQAYEIRQSLEVWPTPADTTWKIRIKGFFPPLPFNLDTDYTTIDWQAVYLATLAECRAYYKQPTASAAAAQLQAYIGALVAGSHQTARYVPGPPGRQFDAVRPVLKP